MKTMTVSTLLIMTMLMTAVVTQKRSDVCTDVPDDNTHQALRPQIAQQFKVDVECNLQERKSTVFVKEYYDYGRNRGRLTVTKASGVRDLFMDYDRDLIMAVDPNTGQCTSGLLVMEKDQFIFGFKLQGSQSQMFSPSAALRFSSSAERYAGQAIIRGIAVDHWQSCQYIQVINATAKVDWYFSRSKAWNMQTGETAAAPVRMAVVGLMVLNNQTLVPFKHEYDFFNYQPAVTPHHFEVPDGVYCPERNLLDKPKPFPGIPSSFFFTGELADSYHSQFSTLKEFYSSTSKMTMYQIDKYQTGLKNIDHHTQLNDYNSGVSYTVDEKSGSCEGTSIPKARIAFYVRINSTHIRMKTPKEFFAGDDSSYEYAGNVTIRNMNADRWISWSNKIQGYEDLNVTIVWYFAQEELTSWSQYRMPILFQMFLPDWNRTGLSYEYNIFGFRANSRKMNLFDASGCFKDTQRVPIRFTIPNDQASTVKDDVVQFKLALKSAISDYSGISPLRIADIQVYFNADNVEVSLDLLDKPPAYQGVAQAGLENSLCNAFQMLNDTFNDGSFVLSYAQGVAVNTVTPDSNSLEALTEIVCGPAQINRLFGAGALAGLGVAMLVVGGLGGGAGAFFFFK